MQTLLKRLQFGIGSGAALWAASAGCSTALDPYAPVADADVDANRMQSDAARDATIPDRDAALVPDAARDSAVRVPDAGEGLRPYPLSALGCNWGSDAGVAAGCCHSVQCYVLEGRCPAIDDPNLPYPNISGEPGCESSGPYAPNPADPAEWIPDGDCCYIIGSFAVEGRPLFVADQLIVAAVITRSDWLA